MWGAALITLRAFQLKIYGSVEAVKAPACSLGLVLLAAALAGCATGSNAIDDAVPTGAISMADPSPSIAPDPFGPTRTGEGGETDRLIDEDTIRLAVTTADLDKLVGGALPWASAATGSSGSVSSIEQDQIAGQTCRRFTATRNAYDGATLYRGEVCLDPRSGWWTRSMRPAAAADSAG